MISGFDLLGAERAIARPMSFGRGALAIGAGLVGALLIRKHPVLAFLNAAALASNTHAVITNDRTVKGAIKRMGRHVVATAGSLALPKHPAMGYVAGAIAADLLIDDEGGGIIEEWADYEGVRSTPKKEIIDAKFSEVKTNNALVKK